jgi:nucleolar protein 56
MLTPFEKDNKSFKSPKEAAEAYMDSESGGLVGDLEAVAISKGFVKSRSEFVKYMNTFSIELTKLRIKQKLSPLTVMAQAVNGVEDIDVSANMFYERLSEMYDTYFPEANRKMNLEIMANLLSKDPIREAVAKELKIGEGTMGVDVGDRDIAMMKGYAQSIKNLLSLRSKLVDYVNLTMEQRCKNLFTVCGGLLGARLIAIAGSLEKLARMPSSTVQLLGAEKALFRHLKTGAKPPKHGIILQHPLVSRANNRGRMARAVSSKIAIAAKLDFYGGKFAGKELLKELEERS